MLGKYLKNSEAGNTVKHGGMATIRVIISKEQADAARRCKHAVTVRKRIWLVEIRKCDKVLNGKSVL